MDTSTDTFKDTYAPRPGDIKKVILVTYGEQDKDQIKTYENLLEALAAVYRLDPQLREAVKTAVQVATTGGDGE